MFSHFQKRELSLVERQAAHHSLRLVIAQLNELRNLGPNADQREVMDATIQAGLNRVQGQVNTTPDVIVWMVHLLAFGGLTAANLLVALTGLPMICAYTLAEALQRVLEDSTSTLIQRGYSGQTSDTGPPDKLCGLCQRPTLRRSADGAYNHCTTCEVQYE